MSRGAALAALALLLGCAGPAARRKDAPSAVSAALTAVDAELAHAEAGVDSLERPPAQSASPPDCRAGFDLDAFLARAFKEGRLPEDPLMGERPTLAMALNWLFACRALASDDMAACAPLAPLSKEKFIRCEPTFLELKMYHDFIVRAPHARKTCEESVLSPVQRGVGEGRAGDFCDALVAGLNQTPETACRRVEPFLEPKQRRKCRPLFRSFSGDGACEGYPYGESRFLCIENAAFFRARAKGDPELCGKAGFCRVWLGQGAAACRSYADLVAHAACEVEASARPAVDPALERIEALTRRRGLHSGVESRLSAAWRLLEAAEDSADYSDRDALAALDAREQRASDLGERSARLGEALSAP
jgi:hypothetical protein